MPVCPEPPTPMACCQAKLTVASTARSVVFCNFTLKRAAGRLEASMSWGTNAVNPLSVPAAMAKDSSAKSIEKNGRRPRKTVRVTGAKPPNGRRESTRVAPSTSTEMKECGSNSMGAIQLPWANCQENPPSVSTLKPPPPTTPMGNPRHACPSMPASSSTSTGRRQGRDRSADNPETTVSKDHHAMGFTLLASERQRSSVPPWLLHCQSKGGALTVTVAAAGLAL